VNDRYKRSIVTALILSAVLSPFVFFSSPLKSWQNPPRAVVLLQDAIYPFEWAWSQSVDSLMSGIKRYVYLSNAAHENEDLRSTLGSMQSRIMDYEEQLLENERLRRLLGFANRSEKSMVAAEVIGHNSLSQFESIRISRGESDGIRNGMPVVSADGVVGKVIRTGFKFADVQLLVDTDFHIDVLLQRTRVRGVLAGDSGRISKLQLHKRVEIRIGDTLITSGIVGGFPKGLPVGRVIRISYETENVAQSITVEPWVDHRRLEEVMVILNDDQELEKLIETAGEPWIKESITGAGGG
jgi:rod shape-determining protein MreC